MVLNTNDFFHVKKKNYSFSLFCIQTYTQRHQEHYFTMVLLWLLLSPLVLPQQTHITPKQAKKSAKSHQKIRYSPFDFKNIILLRSAKIVKCFHVVKGMICIYIPSYMLLSLYYNDYFLPLFLKVPLHRIFCALNRDYTPLITIYINNIHLLVAKYFIIANLHFPNFSNPGIYFLLLNTNPLTQFLSQLYASRF